MNMKRHFILAGALLALAACASLDKPRDFIVFFQTDQATLTPEAQQVIADVAKQAKDVSPSKIVVAGRADGNTAHDATLADDRATIVMRALSDKGIPAEKLSKLADAPPAERTGVAAHQVVITLLP
jgi:outer membrane protein OmpA-like peptidoglycan-associated protein